jgi:hypothetical protein
MLDLLTTNTTVLLPASTLYSLKTQGVQVDTSVHMVLLPLLGCFFDAFAIIGMARWLPHQKSLQYYERQYTVEVRTLSSVIWPIRYRPGDLFVLKTTPKK